MTYHSSLTLSSASTSSPHDHNDMVAGDSNGGSTFEETKVSSESTIPQLGRNKRLHQVKIEEVDNVGYFHFTHFDENQLFCERSFLSDLLIDNCVRQLKTPHLQNKWTLHLGQEQEMY